MTVPAAPDDPPNVCPPGPLQGLLGINVITTLVPMGLDTLPLSSVPLDISTPHDVSIVPVIVSVRASVPRAPPGLLPGVTVQVDVEAAAEVTPTATARAAVRAVRTMVRMRLRTRF